MHNPASLADPIQPLTEREFSNISQLAYEKFGLQLKPEKYELVTARLGKKVRAAGCRSFQEYYQRVVEDRTGEALIELIDALATNFTNFLREPAHFDFLLKEVLPSCSRSDRLSIWSAACSTGEEPYTIALSVLDALGGTGGPQLRILATDISSKALAEARRAVYPAAKLENLSPGWLRTYFLRGEGRWKGYYRVKPEVTQRVEFRRLNLIERASDTELFRVIFCRNVMIYFDKPTQQKLVARLAAQLEPGGYLFIGHSESLTGVDHPLSYVRPTIYRKAGR